MKQKTPFGQRLINFIFSIGVCYAALMWMCDGSMSYARWPYNWQIAMEFIFWILVVYHLFDLGYVIENEKRKDKEEKEAKK